MPYFLASRFAAITMPSPLLPPPTQTGRPSKLESKAISQLAKNESPSTCRIRLLWRLIGNRDVNASSPSVEPKLFTLVEALENKWVYVQILDDGNA